MVVMAIIIKTAAEEDPMEEDTMTMMTGTTIETTTVTMIETGVIRLLHRTEAAGVTVAAAVEIGIMRKIMEEVEGVVGMATMMMREDIARIMMTEVEVPHRVSNPKPSSRQP